MTGHWTRLFCGVFAASSSIRGLVLLHDGLWAFVSLVTLALGLTGVIVETTLLVIDVKRPDDDRVPPWPVVSRKSNPEEKP